MSKRLLPAKVADSTDDPGLYPLDRIGLASRLGGLLDLLPKAAREYQLGA